uniref:MARVEL domain-containing protein n=1 Tax=Mycena chlorophos TaxID=658473 RepID=A0ABQ0MA79_MYCCL|nr:predicted protein [Mycena chlorophos]GAT60307.1 predicted protein [Mycena chlorophos]
MFRYHPLLFTLITLLAIVELGLSAHWVNLTQNEPSSRFKSLIDLFLFDSVWTLLFGAAYCFFILDGAMHVLASIGSSSIWLIITAIFWGVAAGLFGPVRGSTNCNGTSGTSPCRQLQALYAIGWTEFALCILTLLLSVFWVHSGRRSYRGSYYV